jgi:hypothetical protein
MKLTESTTVSITLVVVLVGGVGWLTTMNVLGMHTAKKVDALESKVEQKGASDQMFKEEVLQRLVRIEEKISRKD